MERPQNRAKCARCCKRRILLHPKQPVNVRERAEFTLLSSYASSPSDSKLTRFSSTYNLLRHAINLNLLRMCVFEQERKKRGVTENSCVKFHCHSSRFLGVRTQVTECSIRLRLFPLSSNWAQCDHVCSINQFLVHSQTRITGSLSNILTVNSEYIHHVIWMKLQRCSHQHARDSSPSLFVLRFL